MITAEEAILELKSLLVHSELKGESSTRTTYLITKYCADYLNENKKLIQKHKFLFPGKTTPQMKSDTIAVTINKIFKKNNCKPADIGIETVKRTYRKAKSNYSMLEFAAMYQKLK